MNELLLMNEVIKSYEGHQVLKNGHIDIRPGEIHALIGANGAGKSTLMKILYGITRPEGGTILFDGQKVSFKNVAEAQAAGIFMIHQELQVVKDLTVAQNIFLGKELMKGISVDDDAMNSKSSEVLEAIGLDIHPATMMGELSPATQQLTQIAALLIQNPKLIILDEPTTALGDEDVEKLFYLMRKFKARGISLIFISHRLDELFAVCDRITVMRNGTFVLCESTEKLSKEQLVFHMTGRAVTMNDKTESRVSNDAPNVLEVEHLHTATGLHDVNFHLKKGEILGFTGLMSSGRTEVARAVCGLDPITDGVIRVNGEEVRITSSVDAMKRGIGYLSEDRNAEGLIYGKDVIFNTAISSLDKYTRGLHLDDRSILEDALTFNEQVGTVTSNFFGAIENLSGGNRQKVIIARALMKDLQILFLDEPTRGIDVGAREEIYQIIERLAQDGHSVVVMSSQPDEIRTLCDRVMVMYEGTVAGELPAGQLSNENIMHFAAGMAGGYHETN